MAANKIPSHQTEDVLQEIRTRKAEVKSQIKESADFIKTTTHKLFTPPTSHIQIRLIHEYGRPRISRI